MKSASLFDDNELAKHGANAETWTWDVGRTVPEPTVALFQREDVEGSIATGMRTYKMIGKKAKGFGSVQVLRKGILPTTVPEEDRYREQVKIYPRLVHVLKALVRHRLNNVPATYEGLYKKLALLKGLYERLCRHHENLGGFRVEISLKGSWANTRLAAAALCCGRGLQRFVYANCLSQ